MPRSIWQRINQEMRQEYALRKGLLSKISKHFHNRYVIGLYTRFRSNVTIDSTDPEMLTTILGDSKRARKNRVLFMIHSPGGDPLAAERIIKVLREYSSDDYWVLVPGTAKSAATMICFGASKIILSPISELGPIDLQVIRGDSLIPAYAIIDAYDKLVEKGTNLAKEHRIEPILQQLQAFDPSEIEFFRRVNELSSDIAIKVLGSGMFKNLGQERIKKLIRIFLDPSRSKTHGRPMYYSDIQDIDKDKNFNLEFNVIDLTNRFVAWIKALFFDALFSWEFSVGS